MKSIMVGPVILLVASCLCQLVSASVHSFEQGGGGFQSAMVHTSDDEDVEVSVSSFDSSETEVIDVGECKCTAIKPRDNEETIGHIKITMKDGMVCTNVEPVDVVEGCKGFCFSKDKPGPFGKYDSGITQCHFCGRVQTFVDVMMKCRKKKYKVYGYKKKEYYETYRQLFKNVPLDTGCKCQDCTPEHEYGGMGSKPAVDYKQQKYRKPVQYGAAAKYGADPYSPPAPPAYGGDKYKPSAYGGDKYKPPAYGGEKYKPPAYGGDKYKPPAYGGDKYKPPAYGGDKYKPPPPPPYGGDTYQPPLPPPYGGDTYKPPPPPYGGDTYKPPPPPPYGGDTYKPPSPPPYGGDTYNPPPPPPYGGNTYNPPAYGGRPAYQPYTTPKELPGGKCKQIDQDSKSTYGQFTMGTCEDSKGKRTPCCYNADYISGLVKGCTGICQSEDNWSRTNYDAGDAYYKTQTCTCCNPIMKEILVKLTCPYYYYKNIKRKFSVQTGCKCQKCNDVDPYAPFKPKELPPTTCLTQEGRWAVGAITMRVVNYNYGQCFEDRCTEDGNIRRYSISCEVGDSCKTHYYDNVYGTIGRFVYKYNDTTTCSNINPVKELVCHCGGTCLSYTSTNYGGDYYDMDNLHTDSTIVRNGKCCEAVTGWINVTLNCYTGTDRSVTTTMNRMYNVPLNCMCIKCKDTGGGGYGGGYGAGSSYGAGGSYSPPAYSGKDSFYPQTPRPDYQPPNPGYQPPNPGYQPPNPGYQPPNPGYQPPNPGYQPPPPYNPQPYHNMKKRSPSNKHRKVPI